MLAIKANMKAILSINLEVEEIYFQISKQHKQLLANMHGNRTIVEFLGKIQPKLRMVAQELHATPEIGAHKFVRNNITLSIERDSQNPRIFHLSLRQ